ncbi:hypothetical protein [Spiroplasma endosymbiont of Villa modesta]|uniref:hypothetical protein n=1 Tax=Spiroplasma endosymbiont of Villa modesta TaxID=3066293 RepID=UPI00313ADCB6
MKYFNPSYWFKLWMLTVPFFQNKNQGINGKWIDNNEKIKNWASNNTNLQSINQDISFTNLNTNYQRYNLNQQLPNQNIDLFYQIKLQTNTHKHRHEKHRNRLKRENFFDITSIKGNEITNVPFSFSSPITVSFVPIIFEGIIDYYYYWKDLNFDNPKKKFGEIFKEKIKDMYNNGEIKINFQINWSTVNKFGQLIFDNFLEIEKTYANSSKQERIEINFEYYNFKSVRIITEDILGYPNKCFDNLKRDFPDWNKNIEINLGKININKNYEYWSGKKDDSIKTAIKRKYLSIKKENIKIINWKDYSYFDKCFKFQLLAKNYARELDDCYSYGSTKPIFTYITQNKLNEINYNITNNVLFQDWIEDIRYWNSTLPQAINNAKTFTPEQLYNWKRQERINIQGYVSRWKILIKIIDDEMKIDELSKNLQGLKNDFKILNKTVNELETRVSNLENESNWNCANTVNLVGELISYMPVIGTVGSKLSAITSGTCAIAGI